MLSVRDLSFSYGAVQALSHVDLDCRPGEVTCIIGRNGVGKTTLMKNIIGTVRGGRGSIRLEDQELLGSPAHQRARRGLALVPQGREIFPKLTVEENLRVGLQARRGPRRQVPEEIYQTFPILREFRSRRGGDLSGGQQQQLAIGRALCGDPSVMLLDEPTEGIQPNVIQDIGRVLRRLASERQMTIILVEQYLDFVKEIGDRFVIMNRGAVVAAGPTGELSDELIDAHLKV